eukprot:GFYU01034654.1.p1 GENE.GFYU01034654.1~~GFYU01034654.1.p1  ORF type:complete len:317 (-),score=54.95 GFYU01034654.1:17-967(-)
MGKALFLGNSFTKWNGLAEQIQSLLESGPTDVRLKEYMQITPGGCSLKTHLNKSSDAISDQPWQWIVLQEQSTKPIKSQGKFFEASKDMCDMIRSRQSKVKIIFYMTWPRANANEEDSELLLSSYETIARETSSLLAPVGRAWIAVRRSHPDINLYAADGSHPSPLGTYLAALVFYSVLSGKPCSGLPCTIVNSKKEVKKGNFLIDTDDATAKALQTAADAAVAQLNEHGGGDCTRVSAPAAMTLSKDPKSCPSASTSAASTTTGVKRKAQQTKTKKPKATPVKKTASNKAVAAVIDSSAATAKVTVTRSGRVSKR